MKTRISSLIAFAIALTPLSAAEWKTQFFHDKDESTLTFRDLNCPSATICLGAAVIFETGKGKEKPKGTLITTSDGGAHWSYLEQKELPYSLFFLNAKKGWMVTDKGIWGSEDAGLSWTKLDGLKGIERVYFLDESHGFAVGELMGFYETTDGGKKWNKREIPTLRQMEPKDVLYQGIRFLNPQVGILYGSWNPNAAAQQTDWMEMDPKKRSKGQMSAILTFTKDGGKTWEPNEAKIRGRLATMGFGEDDSALALVDFLDGNRVPSELFKIGMDNPTSNTALFDKEGCLARDFVVLPSGDIVIAAVELMGKSAEIPIPTKLLMMTGTKKDNWVNEPADYRAVAQSPIVAAADDKNVWVATDTGMILKRTE